MKQALDEIIRMMGRTHGSDISHYDKLFLMKSLKNRLTAIGIKSAQAYISCLEQNSAEAQTFFRSLQIPYSEFFRNQLTFALLEQLILPSLIAEKEKADRAEIRVWSAGCATGQEPYSIAILLDDLIAAGGNPVGFRIFATDISEAELAAARKGVFDLGTVQNVRMKHFHKYFNVMGDSCTINPALKERIDFSIFDLLDDCLVCPPASIYGEFDLVICCNLLFYYRPDIRQLILNKVYRALSPGGYFATGEAERAIVAKTGGLRAVFPPAPVFQSTNIYARHGQQF